MACLRCGSFPKKTFDKSEKSCQTINSKAILIIAYHVIQRQNPYRELEAQYFDQQHPEATAKQLVKRLEILGYQVSVQFQDASVAA